MSASLNDIDADGLIVTGPVRYVGQTEPSGAVFASGNGAAMGSAIDKDGKQTQYLPLFTDEVNAIRFLERLAKLVGVGHLVIVTVPTLSEVATLLTRIAANGITDVAFDPAGNAGTETPTIRLQPIHHVLARIEEKHQIGPLSAGKLCAPTNYSFLTDSLLDGNSNEVPPESLRHLLFDREELASEQFMAQSPTMSLAELKKSLRADGAE